MSGIIGFLRFEKLIGRTLVVLVFYLGVAGITLSVLTQMFAALQLMVPPAPQPGMGGLGSYGQAPAVVGPAMGVVWFFAAPITGLVSLVFWRFACELGVILFDLSMNVSKLRTIGEHALMAPAVQSWNPQQRQTGAYSSPPQMGYTQPAQPG